MEPMDVGPESSPPHSTLPESTISDALIRAEFALVNVAAPTPNSKPLDQKL